MNFISRLTTVGLALVAASTAHAAIEMGGNNEQATTLKNSPVTSVSLGPAARAKVRLASNEGNVKVGANNRQTVDATNSPVTAAAIGPAAQAEISISSNKS